MMTDKTEIEQVCEAIEYIKITRHSAEFDVFLAKTSSEIIEEEIEYKENHLILLDDIKKALQEKLERLENGGWLPIESAPRTGERILLAVEGHPIANYGHWFKIKGRFEYDGYDFANSNQQPTHWQPLPPAPKQGDK